MKPTLFIISLEDAVERRAPLLKELDTRNIPYEIWNAVDGRSELAPEHEALIDRAATHKNLGRPMSNAEYGCALSHHLVYKAILERGLHLAVILEDDAIVGDEFFDAINNIGRPHFDLLLLDHEWAVVSRTDRMKFGNNILAYRCKSQPDRTTGYCVTRSGAFKLVKWSTPIAALADWPVDITQMQAYAVSPRLVDHPDPAIAASYIEHDRYQLQMATARKRRNSKRFLEAKYWRRKYYKRFGKWIS